MWEGSGGRGWEAYGKQGDAEHGWDSGLDARTVEGARGAHIDPEHMQAVKVACGPCHAADVAKMLP